MLKRQVLVAEDSPVIRKLISVCLRGLDVEIAEVEDGPSAVDAALASPPDAMILDVGLPGKEGWDVLREIRADPRTADVPVLMLTGHAGDSIRRKAEAVGASAFMTKPFQPAELRSALVRLISVENVVPLREAN